MAKRTARLTGLLTSTAVAGALLVASPVAPAAAATTAVAAPAATAAAAPTGERNTKVSRSMRGVRASAYVGKYYSSRHEAKRRCIVRKESGGNYRIRSRSGTYKGAYQFNAHLARYAAKKMGKPSLANRPMNTWSRFDQDKAFWTIWNHGRGAGNWPTRHGC
jgi:hypothetical protein